MGQADSEEFVKGLVMPVMPPEIVEKFDIISKTVQTQIKEIEFRLALKQLAKQEAELRRRYEMEKEDGLDRYD